MLLHAAETLPPGWHITGEVPGALHRYRVQGAVAMYASAGAGKILWQQKSGYNYRVAAGHFFMERGTVLQVQHSAPVVRLWCMQQGNLQAGEKLTTLGLLPEEGCRLMYCPEGKSYMVLEAGNHILYELVYELDKLQPYAGASAVLQEAVRCLTERQQHTQQWGLATLSRGMKDRMAGLLEVKEEPDLQRYMYESHTLDDLLQAYLINVSPPEPPALIAGVRSYIAMNATENITMQQLVQKFSVPAALLKRDFQKRFGMPIMDYHRKERIKLASELIVKEQASFTDIAYRCGFYDSAHFTRVFKAETGFTPSAFRLQRINAI